MAQTFTGRKRVRKVFGHVKEVGEMPNLIEVQKASYEQFLLMEAPKGGRPNEGLQSVFKSVFPISDFSGSEITISNGGFPPFSLAQPVLGLSSVRLKAPQPLADGGSVSISAARVTASRLTGLSAGGAVSCA